MRTSINRLFRPGRPPAGSAEVTRRPLLGLGLIAGSALLAATAITLWLLMVF